MHYFNIMLWFKNYDLYQTLSTKVAKMFPTLL